MEFIKLNQIKTDQREGEFVVSTTEILIRKTSVLRATPYYKELYAEKGSLLICRKNLTVTPSTKKAHFDDCDLHYIHCSKVILIEKEYQGGEAIELFVSDTISEIYKLLENE